MKKEEFLEKKAEAMNYVIREIMIYRKNILGETVEYDFQTKLTAKEKSDIKADFENVFAVESVSFNNTIMTVNFTLSIGYKDVTDYLNSLPAFHETLLPSSYVVDEDESVRWNREKVLEINEGIKSRKLLDIQTRKVLAATKKQALIYEVRAFNNLDSVKYESIEILYNYLDSLFNGDMDKIAKEIFGLANTVIAFTVSEDLKLVKLAPLKQK